MSGHHHYRPSGTRRASSGSRRPLARCGRCGKMMALRGPGRKQGPASVLALCANCVQQLAVGNSVR